MAPTFQHPNHDENDVQNVKACSPPLARQRLAENNSRSPSLGPIVVPFVFVLSVES